MSSLSILILTFSIICIVNPSCYDVGVVVEAFAVPSGGSNNNNDNFNNNQQQQEEKEKKKNDLFPFSLPEIEIPSFPLSFPWQSQQQSSASSSASSSDDGALQPGDTVAVIGASGNVGKLVALRLSDTYKVHGIVRDASSAALEGFLQERLDSQKMKLYESDLLELLQEQNQEQNSERLQQQEQQLIEALETANALVICTGTTAFPTQAWGRTGTGGEKKDNNNNNNNNNFSVTNTVIKALWDNKFNIQNTMQELDEMGLNTPENVDAKCNQYVVDKWINNSSRRRNVVKKKRCIMLSSIGVERRNEMPFPILNTCGVLDAKARGEAAIKNAASANDNNNNGGSLSYTIIRPGQLFGGPYDNNFYLGTLFQLDKDAATQDVVVEKGDTLVGDTLRSTLAEITAQVCEGNFALNTDFAVVNVKGEPSSLETVQERLAALG